MPPRTTRRRASFLLTQVGSHAAARFAERIAPLGLTPPDVGVLRLVSRSAGMSQQELASALKLHPSRLVSIIDKLEAGELVERQANAEDRRTYALQLTPQGRSVLTEVGRLYEAHHDALCSALTEEEQEHLAGFLERIAAQQGLTPGIHPGYSRLGAKPGK
ncbi:MAG TPA: MarR family transcriptional regulator [Bryobacteraceae bacterium]|nr:MarR family transcriptional regulator [Bryobacteraceae bacterium]